MRGPHTDVIIFRGIRRVFVIFSTWNKHQHQGNVTNIMASASYKTQPVGLCAKNGQHVEKANNSHKSQLQHHESMTSCMPSTDLWNDHDEKDLENVVINVDADTTYPHDAWEERYKKQFPNARVLKPKSLLLAPQPDKNTLRFVCMSDTHGREQHGYYNTRVPDGDVLLHAGDFTMHSELHEYRSFNEFLVHLPHKVKVVIPGNHELDLDPRGLGQNPRKLRQQLGLPQTVTLSEERLRESVEEVKNIVSEAKILIDEMVEICGIKIYGLPWLPQYGLFGFGLSRGHALLKRYNRCPAGIDILLSHGPALGFGDFISRRKHVGCVELLNSVTKRIKPKYVVSGHIHEGYGISTDGERTYINCAACNASYRPVQDPIVFDYVLPEPYSREDFDLLSPQELTVIKPWQS